LKAQEELQKIPIYDAKIDSKLEELSRLQSMATKVTAVMDSEVVSRTRNTDTMGDTVAKIIAMQDEINSLIDLYTDTKAHFSKIIDELQSPIQIKVLYGHYFHGKSFQKLADELGYSRRNICYIHGDALVAVEKIIAKGESFPAIS
jgi:transcriptional regulator